MYRHQEVRLENAVDEILLYSRSNVVSFEIELTSIQPSFCLY